MFIKEKTFDNFSKTKHLEWKSLYIIEKIHALSNYISGIESKKQKKY